MSAVVTYRCDAAGRTACLLLSVIAGPDGPIVELPAQRLAPSEARRQGRGSDKRSLARRVPLADLAEAGVFGPVTCDHRRLELRTSALEADYAAGLTRTHGLTRCLPDGSEAWIY